ncbi:MAG TPA: nuclear transport factor 2 family protein [Gemmatimonadales bacterium]
MSRSWRFRRALPLALALSILPGMVAAQGVETPHIPLRTVIDQLNSVRSSYMDAFNRKDASGVAAFYLDEAIVTRPDGSRLMGGKEIGEALKAEAANWPHLVLTSDTVRVYGGTAIDFGTAKMHPADGGEQVSHYTAILRRGLKGWKIAALSQVAVGDQSGK